MNKIVRGLTSVYNGFVPVSQIKGTFAAIIILYLVFLAFGLQSDFSTYRSIKMENKQQGGIVIMNGIKHLVPFTATSTRMEFEVNGPVDFMLLSNGDLNDSFATALLKVITCLLALKLLWSFSFSDPFNVIYYKQVTTLGWMGMLILVMNYLKDFYTAKWVKDINHNSSGFQYKWEFNIFYFVASIWVIRALMSFYQTAVKTQREADLTI